jgi:hypothetical protein
MMCMKSVRVQMTLRCEVCAVIQGRVHATLDVLL